MIVLHSSQDEDSRAFVNNLLGRTVGAGDFVNGVLTESGHTIYDWYAGGREAWWDIAGTAQVSAFPSVIVDVPEYNVDRNDGLGLAAQDIRTIPAEQVALRKVTSVTDVDDYLAKVNGLLTKSKALGKTPAIQTLTRGNLNDASTGRT